MSKAHTHSVQFSGRFGSGSMTAPGAAGWLSLVAAPVFALMALWTGLFSQADLLCQVHDSSLNGMVLMYALMSIFHAPPWMKLITSRRQSALCSSAR
jgi:hypothetical protein